MTDPRHAPIRTGNPPAGTPGGHDDADRVRDLLKATDPAEIATAAASYEDAARRLAELRDLLFHLVRRHAEDEAAASSPSLAALRRLFTDAEHLLAAARTMGEALRAYGGEILPWYVENAPDHGTPADDVDQFMRRLDARIAELWHAFPERIDGAADAPPPRDRGVRLASADPSPDGKKDDKAADHAASGQANQNVVPMVGIPMGAMGGGGRGGGGGSRSRSRKASRRKMDVPSPAVRPAPGLIPDRDPRVLTPGSDGAARPAAATAPRLISPSKPSLPSLPSMPPAPEPGWVPPVSVAESLTAKASEPARQAPPPAPQSAIAEALSAPRKDKAED
ncbi:hypothetical protein [Actinomadura harenae]|uniref:Uncharacterized protein n=1 Tax=Actinomadura harenae TaxID=2483351 RepID=A0A3M2LUJ0_9ACTN|nr:hypothetical protein [Actinomadura harenae]RMI41161.1 hypothetical protein EBO15_23825 [Actinomadura harenae]